MSRAVKPKRIITARDIGLTFGAQGSQGPLGPAYYVTGHYTAGPRDKSVDHAIALDRQYHAFHKQEFHSNGIAYHYNITRNGTLICLRPTAMKGTHVAKHNSNNIGVMFHGTTGDKPTIRQSRTYRWLLENAHTTALPKEHRTDRDLMMAVVRGHKRWPDNATACPGGFLRMIESRGAYR